MGRVWVWVCDVMLVVGLTGCVYSDGRGTVFYKPLPTAKALNQEYQAVLDGYNQQVRQRQMQIEKIGRGTDRCVDGFVTEIEPLKLLVTRDLKAIAVTYELYGYESLPDRFHEKKLEWEKAVNPVFGALDKCLVEVAGQQKTASNHAN